MKKFNQEELEMIVAIRGLVGEEVDEYEALEVYEEIIGGEVLF